MFASIKISCIFVLDKQLSVSLKTNKMTNLKALFVEVVKIELSNYTRLSKNMVANTIQHFAEITPFNKISLAEWHSICSANGVKYDK
jgi:hypothetical protein